MTEREVEIANGFGHDLPGYVTGELPLPRHGDAINQGCLRRHLQSMLSEIAAMEASVARLTEKNKRLQEALENYGQHSIRCCHGICVDVTDDGPEYNMGCDCGLYEALAVREAKEKA